MEWLNSVETHMLLFKRFCLKKIIKSSGWIDSWLIRSVNYLWVNECRLIWLSSSVFDLLLMKKHERLRLL